MKRAWLAIASTIVGVVLVGVGVPAANAGGSTIVTDSFTEASTSNHWVLPAATQQATNEACLAKGTNASATPIPGCGGTTPLGLRVNPASPGTEGGVYYGSSVAASGGLDVVFDSTAVSGANGSGAEGTSFFVAASDPSSTTASTVKLGPGEGHLGYSANNGDFTPAGVDGLTNGYLDVGLDTAGNDASDLNSGVGCNSDPEAVLPNSIDVRGPGSGTNGYCLLSENQYTGSFDSSKGTTLHVEVAINSTTAALVDAGGFTVKPDSYEVEANPGGGALQVITSESLPDASTTYTDSSLTNDSGRPLAYTFGWTGSSNSSGGPSDVDTISNASVTTLASAPATALGFLTEPVDAMVNATMTNPDSTPTDLQVGAEVTPGGSVDPSYTGPVTLGFGKNPGKAKFLDQANGTTTSTLTANAVDGVADFSPIVINAVGFGYTLTAQATGLTGATSTPFDVAAAATVCAPKQSCTVSATGAAGTGVSAIVTGKPGPNGTVLSASFGGNVAPLHPCASSSAGVLTFNGARQKVIRFTVATKRPIFLFCYGQPKPFIDLTLHKTKFFSAVNQEYEGLLAPCISGVIPAPCISNLALGRSSETVTVAGASGDLG